MRKFSAASPLMAAVLLCLTNFAPATFAGTAYCSNIPGSPEFAACLSQEITTDFLKAMNTDPRKADSQIGTSANATSDVAGSILGAAARRYFPSMGFTTQTGSKCLNYNVGVKNGADQVEVDKSSCLQVGILIGQSDSGVTVYACYAYHDQPVIQTGLSCKVTSNGALPLNSGGQNAAVIGGAVLGQDLVVCNEATATHSNLASSGNRYTGFEQYNNLTICTSIPR